VHGGGSIHRAESLHLSKQNKKNLKEIKIIIVQTVEKIAYGKIKLKKERKKKKSKRESERDSKRHTKRGEVKIKEKERRG
jgi:hypothetical protein